jgi:hypothetical protein
MGIYLELLLFPQPVHVASIVRSPMVSGLLSIIVSRIARLCRVRLFDFAVRLLHYDG